MNNVIAEESNENIYEADTVPSNKNKLYLVLEILLAAMFSFNLFVFAPLESYLNSVNEFWFGLNDIWPSLLFLFVLSGILVFCILHFFFKKLKLLLMSLCFSLTLALYVQGNYMMSGYPLLDGEAIKWEQMAQKGVISTIVWIVIFAIPIVVLLIKKGVFQNLIKLVAITLIGLQLVTLSTLLIQNGTPAGNSVYLSTEQMMTFSKKDNIIVIVSDTFESGYFNRALNEMPELKEEFKDFTYYQNTSGISTMTYLSVPTMLTGENFPLGKASKEGVDKVFENTSFFESLADKKYDVNLFTDSMFMSESLLGHVTNLKNVNKGVSLDTRISLTKSIYQYAFFKYMPHYAKKAFVMDVSQFTNAQAENGKPAYDFDDKQFLETVKSSQYTKLEDRNVFNFFHLDGIHAPNDTDRNLNPITYAADVPHDERRYEQSLGQINILKSFIAQLKENDVYDNSTIVFTADHGYMNRFDVVFMVKPKNENSSFKFSNAPISLMEDFIPFVLDVASGKGKDASFYQIEEGKPRERYAYSYVSYNGYGTTANSKTTISIPNKASDSNKYYSIKDEFYSPAIPKKYKFGKKINMNIKANNAKFLGFSPENNEVCTKTAYAEIEMGAASTGDLKVNIGLKKVRHPDQRLIVSVSGTEIFNQVIPQNELKISFTVPRTLVNSDVLKLDFQFPNAKINNSDGDSLAWLQYHSFWFDFMTIEPV